MGNKQTKVLKFKTSYGIKELKVHREYMFRFSNNLWPINTFDLATLTQSCTNFPYDKFRVMRIIYEGNGPAIGSLRQSLENSQILYLTDLQIDLLNDILEEINNFNTQPNIEGEN